ncbi:FAD-dependent oxidoreductase [Zhengella sp. ZM62]|uniref:FAD-dependent oxidoreductase n=1 Tax=Zhengella sedimenti TaxID=3390035 RepID=UPI0039752C34
MIFSGPEQYRSSGFRPRVIVVGSGPAGVTIALALGRAGIPVTILEAGSEAFTESSQAFYRGEVRGDPYFDLDITRLRHFGGSSNHWAGWCRLLDPHDFEPRAHVPESGWPVGAADLAPWLEEARSILELPPFPPARTFAGDLEQIGFIKSEPVRFARNFRAQIAASRHVALVTDAYVPALHGDGRRVTGLDLWSRGAPAGRVAAGHVVVAAGGLENARLLLWSNIVSGRGVVPMDAALGRYWMEHPAVQAGDMVLFGDPPFATDDDGEAFFGPSRAALEARQILNFHVRLIEDPYPGAKHLLAQLACVAPGLAEWGARRAGLRLRCAAQLHVGWEQAPDWSNHVALSATGRDAAGVPRIVLNWRIADSDLHTIRQAMTMTGEAMIRAGAGRVRLAPWLREGSLPRTAPLAAHHHMGGTRMGTDPRTSVVDADCRVHGMENLFIAGSSVFPTSGHANPTTTIVLLALRLADHLVRRP